MTRYVALLRGINVGGRALKMTDLRDIVTGAGGTNIATYIQSGNVVFDHRARSTSSIESRLAEAIEDATGMDVPVIARTADEWDALIAANPFPDAGGTTLHVVFLDHAPSSDALDHLDLGSFAPEECSIVGSELYLHLPDGMGRAKLPVELNKRNGLMSTGTARNWNTVLKLREMVTDSS